MATPQELLAALGARRVAGTSLQTMGGRLPNQRQVVRPQAPQAPTLQPRAVSRLAQLPDANPVQPVAEKAGGGIKAGLGKILGVAMKPLDVLQTPQRGVLLGLEGMAKQGTLGLDSLFDMEAINADQRGIRDKLTDGSYSMDDLTKSVGNKYADFAINFAGDVATDPLTYVTLGTTSVAGKGARMGLAARAAEKGLGDDVVRRAAKGASFLKPAEREIMGVEKAGVRFLGQRIGGEGDNFIARGNQALANAVGKTTGTIRTSVTKSRPWQVISRKPEGLEDAYRVLETGQSIGRLTPTAAASVVGWDEAYRATMKTIVNTHAPAVADAFKGIDEAARRELTHAMENGTDATLRPFLDDLLGEARKAGIKIGDIENYMPHVWSREARGFLQGVNLQDSERAVIDLTAESGVNLTRRLRGGDIYVDGKPIDIGKGTIREINEALSKAFPDAPVERWLEDDAAELMSHYINGVASDIGEVKAFDRLLQSRAGVANPLDDVSDEVIDRVATRTANKEKAAALKETLTIRREAFKLEQEQARKDAAQLQTVLRDYFTTEAEKYGALGQKVAESLKNRKGTASLDAEAKALGKQVIAARQQAERQLAALEKRWYELEEEISAAQVRLTNQPSNQERLAQYNEIVRTRLALAKEIEDGKAAVAETERLTELLLENIRISRQLDALMDDPDELQALAQRIVPSREVEVTRPLEGPPSPIITQADERLRNVDRNIEDLEARLAADTAGETQSLERMATDFDAAVSEARQAVKDIQAEVEQLGRNVARAQARRGTDPRRADTVDMYAKMFDLLGLKEQKEQMLAAWREEGRDLWRLRQVEDVANRRVENIKASEQMFNDAAAKADEKLGPLLNDVNASIPEGSSRGKEIETALAESERALKNAALARQQLPLFQQHARSARQAGGEAIRGSKAPNWQLNEMATLRANIEIAEREVADAAAKLPPPEARLVEGLDKLAKAQDRLNALEGVQRNVARQQERAARLGSTPERQLAALKSTRELLKSQADASRAYHARPIDTFTETVTPELPPKAALEAEKAALPTTENIAPPKRVREAIEKVHLKGKVTARDIRKGKLVDQAAINAAPRDIAKEYVGIVRSLRSGVKPEPDDITRAHTLAEFIARYKSALDAGAEAGDGLAARVTREVIDSEVKRVRSRVQSLSAAVDAVEDSPKRLKELRTTFGERLDSLADEIDTAIKRRQGLHHALKNVAGPSYMTKAEYDEKFAQHVADLAAGKKSTAPRRMVSPEDYGVADRSELVGLAAEARQNVETLQQFFPEMLRAITGRSYDDRGRGILNALRLVKPKGSNMTDKELVARSDKIVDDLFKQLTPEAKAATMREMQDTLQRNQRELTRLAAQRRTLGHDGSDVTADWRDVLLGRQGEGTLGAKAEKLDEQLGYYAQTEDALKGARAQMSRENADLQGAIKAQQPAVERLPQAEAELAAMPKSYREKRYTDELDAMSDVIKGERQQGAVNDQIDKVQAALDALDPAAAKQYAAIDQRRKADEFLLKSRTDFKKNVEQRVATMKANAKKVEALKPAKADVDKTFEQLDALVAAVKDDPGFPPAALALHAAYADRMAKMARMDADIQLQDSFLALARKTGKKASKDPNKNFHNVFMREANDGWEHVARNLMTEEDAVAVKSEVAASLRRWKDRAEDGELYKAIDQLTRFFKTYATATPGFHVRNAMSAAFMNMSDGVRLRDFREAMREWSKFKADPKKYMDSITPREGEVLPHEKQHLYDAWQATFGSGAGGAFGKGELGEKAGSSKIMHNAFTNTSRRAGSAVEGVSRLAAAINSTRTGADMYGALNRVSRLHFDYSQLSKLDKKIKLMIPFWTFMSRNLPLQLQQIVMRPRLYSAFDHLRDNVSDDSLGENVPPWLMARDPILFGDAENGVGAIAPDLPHINMLEDYASLSPTDPLRALGQLNPMFTAPVEAASNTNFYYGNEIGGPKDRLNHLASKVLPPVATAQRLGGLGRYEGKETEKRANFMGVPYYNITPEMMQAEMRRRAYSR